MKKSRVKQLNVSTSQHDFLVKPYGFCCDIKDYDPKLLSLKEEPEPLFPSSGPLEGGPDIKFRLQEHDDIQSFRQRSIQRNAQRGGLRSKYRSGQQVIWGNQSYAQPYRRRRYRTPRLEGTVKVPEDRTQGRTPDRGRDIETLGELMICKRCRGPLRWYLEDEIAAARDIMMKRKQEIYKAEMEKNIKIAKQKGIRFVSIMHINYCKVFKKLSFFSIILYIEILK